MGGKGGGGDGGGKGEGREGTPGFRIHPLPRIIDKTLAVYRLTLNSVGTLTYARDPLCA